MAYPETVPIGARRRVNMHLTWQRISLLNIRARTPMRI